HIAGVVVVDGDRPLGWCEREGILSAAAQGRGGQPVGFALHPGASIAGPETTIPDALELASSRQEQRVGAPLIIADERGVSGVVSVGDLMHAAADLTRDMQLRIAPLTGLPGRVLADEHLASLLRNSPPRPEEDALKLVPAHDAALIDVRDFSRYNERMGYELGDELLRRLVELFGRTSSVGPENVYFAHLGDDRFLATAPSGTLEPLLRDFAAAFDRAEAQITAESGDASMTPRLRIVVAAEASRWIASPHALYRLWERWQRELATRSLASEVHVVGDDCDPGRLRRSA
ncbi:MAG TPA: diguanylate cyclase, partial [Phycisphaerales bacterium]